jgi:hypothetical protein
VFETQDFDEDEHQAAEFRCEFDCFEALAVFGNVVAQVVQLILYFLMFI